MDQDSPDPYKYRHLGTSRGSKGAPSTLASKTAAGSPQQLVSAPGDSEPKPAIEEPMAGQIMDPSALERPEAEMSDLIQFTPMAETEPPEHMSGLVSHRESHAGNQPEDIDLINLDHGYDDGLSRHDMRIGRKEFSKEEKKFFFAQWIAAGSPICGIPTVDPEGTVVSTCARYHPRRWHDFRNAWNDWLVDEAEQRLRIHAPERLRQDTYRTPAPEPVQQGTRRARKNAMRRARGQQGHVDIVTRMLDRASAPTASPPLPATNPSAKRSRTRCQHCGKFHHGECLRCRLCLEWHPTEDWPRARCAFNAQPPPLPPPPPMPVPAMDESVSWAFNRVMATHRVTRLEAHADRIVCDLEQRDAPLIAPSWPQNPPSRRSRRWDPPS